MKIEKNHKEIISRGVDYVDLFSMTANWDLVFLSTFSFVLI